MIFASTLRMDKTDDCAGSEIEQTKNSAYLVEMRLVTFPILARDNVSAKFVSH